MIATLPNGVTVQASCTSVPNVLLRIVTLSGNNLVVSGTVNSGGGTTLPADSGTTPIGATVASNPDNVDFDVVARDRTVGPFARIDVHGHTGTPCTFWGMITPSA